MKTVEEKKQIIAKMSNADLLTYHDNQVANFKPIDDEFYENFTLVTDEILRRMEVRNG